MTRLADVRHIVVRPPNWLGDAVLALPAIAAVRRHASWARLTIAAVPAVAALFREETDVRPDRVIEIPSSTRAAVAAIEGEGFDLGLLMPNSFRAAWLFWRAGVRERWGYSTAGRTVLLTRAPRVPRIRRVRHQSDYYRDLISSLGFAVDPGEPPRLSPNAPSIERAAALLAQHRISLDAKLVGVAPGAAYGQAKQWPPERMAALITNVTRSHDVTCAIVGAQHDRDAAREIESRIRTNAPDIAERVVNLAGRTSLGALIGVLWRTSAFVSNDSGAMHVAAALGRPVIAIFGPTDERATSPVGDHAVITQPVFCRPCMLRDCPIDHRCMKRIPVERVAAAVSSALARSGA